MRTAIQQMESDMNNMGLAAAPEGVACAGAAVRAPRGSTVNDQFEDPS
jgi:hypothetical protein